MIVEFVKVASIFIVIFTIPDLIVSITYHFQYDYYWYYHYHFDISFVVFIILIIAVSKIINNTIFWVRFFVNCLRFRQLKKKYESIVKPDVYV